MTPGQKLNITLSLYIMDFIGKKELVRTEPVRRAFASVAWVAGPTIGVFLYGRYGPAGADAFSALCACLVLVYFWILRFRDDPTVAAATRPPPNPLTAIRRYVSQPRLRLGWFIPLARSSWWATFFVYAPLFMVQSGVRR